MFKYMLPEKFSLFLQVVVKTGSMTSARQQPEVYGGVTGGIPHFCGLRSCLLGGLSSAARAMLAGGYNGHTGHWTNWEWVYNCWLSMLSHPADGIAPAASMQPEKTSCRPDNKNLLEGAYQQSAGFLINSRLQRRSGRHQPPVSPQAGPAKARDATAQGTCRPCVQGLCCLV